jgi:hypothetical protein
MPNPYTSQYMPSGFENTDQQGLAPVFQNIGAQQQYLNQQLSQGGQMTQPTSQGTSLSGLNPMAMAAMLRNKQGGASIADRAVNYFGTQQSPEMKAEISQLGSNTWNPMSNYYTGANGWGNYGE